MTFYMYSNIQHGRHPIMQFDWQSLKDLLCEIYLVVLNLILSE